MLTAVELFSGAGGLALAVHQAGFRTKLLAERNRDACASLRVNVRSGFGPDAPAVAEGDVRGLSYAHLSPIDLLAGGPPCQPFSLGGKHRGAIDDRNMMPEFARALAELAPRAFLMENVKGLTRPAFSVFLGGLIASLSRPQREGPAYKVHLTVLNAADYGVPQRRERAFMVGLREDIGATWTFPAPTHSRLGLVRDQWVSGAYWREHELPPPVSGAPPAALLRTAAAETLPRWRTIRDALRGLSAPATGGPPDHRLVPGARTYPGHTGSLVDSPSKTLKAGVHGVPGGENTVVFPDGNLRYLTVREAARIQGFPDAWTFAGAWGEAMRQIGNAVPPPLAGAVAAALHHVLNEANRTLQSA